MREKYKIQITLVLLTTELRDGGKQVLGAFKHFKIESDRATLGHRDSSFILDFLLTLNAI